MNMRRLDLYITEKQMASLLKTKKDTGLSVSELIRRAVDYYLEQQLRKIKG